MYVRRHTLVVCDVGDADVAAGDADEAVGCCDVGHDSALQI